MLHATIITNVSCLSVYEMFHAQPFKNICNTSIRVFTYENILYVAINMAIASANLTIVSKYVFTDPNYPSTMHRLCTYKACLVIPGFRDNTQLICNDYFRVS